MAPKEHIDFRDEQPEKQIGYFFARAKVSDSWLRQGGK